MESGGTVDLSSLSTSGGGRIWFDVGEKSLLRLGNFAVTNKTRFELRHITSKVQATGSLFLNGTSQFLMAEGAQIEVGGDFLYQYTDEARMQFDRGQLHLDGSGMQYLEAGGSDNGLAGTAASNFGIGRLEIGEDGAPTTVHVLDLFNNGNRGTTGEEALYLGGLGGADGLVIHAGSVLVLNGINVYAWLDGQMKHLNSLFGNEVMAIPMSAGLLALQQPLVGDYNFDGSVDGADLLEWQRGLGSAARLAADGNHNGGVDAGDLAAWQNHLGESLSQSNEGQTAVPEPAAVVLVLLSGMFPMAQWKPCNVQLKSH